MTNTNDESSKSSEFSMLEHLVRQGVSRRQFMTACSALTATLAVPPFLRSGVALAVESAAAGETTFWSSCVVNCGSRCPLRVEVVWKRNLVSDRRTVGRLFYAQLTKSRLTAS